MTKMTKKVSKQPAKKVPAKAIKTRVKQVAPVAVPPPVSKKPVAKLGQKVLDEFKEKLLTMRQRKAGDVASLKQDSLQREDAVNSEEDGTDAFERQFALNVASSENAEILEIDEALTRIGTGTYGICAQCNCAIELPRLNALPFVKMCIKCKAENEKGTLKYRPLAEVEREKPE